MEHHPYPFLKLKLAKIWRIVLGLQVSRNARKSISWVICSMTFHLSIPSSKLLNLILWSLRNSQFEGKWTVDRNSILITNLSLKSISFNWARSWGYFSLWSSMGTLLGGSETDCDHSCSTNHRLSSDWIFEFSLKFFNGRLNWGNGFWALRALHSFIELVGNLV